jgi:hypothetical protein
LIRWIQTTVDGAVDGTSAGEALRVGTRYKDDQGKKDLINDMLLILGGGLGHDFQMAERFMEGHWHAHPQLGPYPCSGLLAKCQAAGVFHSGYRDHVGHQLKTYLLGLYVFGNCKPIREAVLNEIGRDLPNGRTPPQEFRLRWLAAALAHDTGYIFENTAADPSGNASDGGALYKQLLKEFGAVVEYPLARSHTDLADESYLANHTRIRTAIAAPTHSVPDDTSLFDLPSFFEHEQGADENGRNRAWNILKEGTGAAGLGTAADKTIETYYHFTKDHPTNYAERFPDHGVVSALLMLRAWYAWADFVRFLDRKLLDGQPIPALTQPAFRWVLTDRSDWAYHQTMHAAASAIALHNIDPRRYTKGSLKSLWEGQFRSKLDIGLTVNDGSQALALAFLLRLCDTLQVWDRQKFRPLEPGEHLLESKAFSLKVDDGGARVSYCGDADAQFNDLIKGLKIALVETQVETFVRQDADETTKYVRVDLFGGQEKPAEAAPDEMPEPAELDDELQQKFKSLSGGKTVTIGVCASPPRKRCPVRTQAVHSLAENARIGSEVHLVGAVLQCLSNATEAAKSLVVYRNKAEDGAIATWLLNLHVAAVHLARLFENRGNKKRPDDTNSLQASAKCESFLRHRAPLDHGAGPDASEIRSAIWGVLELFGAVPSQSAKRSGFAKSLQFEPLWTYLNILTDRGCDFIVALRTAFAKRTIDVSNAITMTPLGNETVAPDAKELGGYIADRIRAFPHNQDKVSGIWRPANQGGKP